MRAAVLLLAAIALCVAAHFADAQRALRTPPARELAAKTVAWCVVLLAWPLLWRRFARNRCHRFADEVTRLWPYALMLVDLWISAREPGNDAAGRGVLVETSSVCGTLFAIAHIVGVSKERGHMALFVAPILLHVTLVWPSVSTDDALLHTLCRTAQKALFICAVSLLVCAVLFTKPPDAREAKAR